jgi:hypothetical protein
LFSFIERFARVYPAELQEWNDEGRAGLGAKVSPRYLA